MKFSLVPLTLFSSVLQGHAVEDVGIERPSLASMIDHFEAWIDDYDKRYDTRGELQRRRDIWMDNHLKIWEHNRKKEHSHTLGHNEFSDLTHEEFLQGFRLGPYSGSLHEVLPDTASIDYDDYDDEEDFERSTRDLELDSNSAKTSMDWVEKGAVTPVKNQGFCGSCWAFSAAGAIEGLAYLRTGVLTNISVQEFLDCDKYDHGCMGGLMNNAFRFDKGIKGMCSAEDYPYVGHKHWLSGCGEAKCDDVDGSDVTKFVNVTKTDAGLKKAIHAQPVSVAIDASAPDFQFYKSGVYSKECKSDLDHGVLAVGYGSEDGEDFWLVKNSWGSRWGEDGYIKLARGPDFPDGQCGIHLMSSRPLV